MEHRYSFKYKNVLIRQIEKQDLEKMRNWRNDPSNCIFLRRIPFITPEKQLEWFNDYLSNKNEIGFSIVETREICEIVGSMFLYNFDGSSAEFGKIMIGDKRSSGKKVGLNAIVSLLYVAFYVLSLKEIHLVVNKNNKKALITYERAGFVKTGHAKNNNADIMMSISLDSFFMRCRNGLY